jgi:hypothetical protein
MIYFLRNNIFLLLIIITFSIKSQNDLLNHKKYWYYKTRLNNDFVKVGATPYAGVAYNGNPSQGESIPFNERGWEDNSLNYTYKSDRLKIGDGTARLGIYLALLATEYRLLKNNGQDISKTKHEIFCALNAINRLDVNAERVFSAGTFNWTLNGFFMRDDIDSGFVARNYPHFNYYNGNSNFTGIGPPPASYTLDKGFTQTFTQGQYVCNSGLSSYLNDIAKGKSKNEALETKEESQDQLYYLLIGLSLTSKLVDPGETDGSNVFGYYSGETRLKEEAINIADRMIKYIKNESSGHWLIRNPANGNNLVQIGGVASTYAYALDNLGCFIKYGHELPFVYIPPTTPSALGIYPYNPCFDYRNAFSSNPAAATTWQTLAQLDGGPQVDSQGFFHSLAGICNCVYEDKKFLNVTIQQSITNVLNLLNNAYNDLNNAIQTFYSSLPSYVSHNAPWVVNIVNTINSFYLTLINGLNSLYNNLLQQLLPMMKTNTTDERLVHNTYLNNVMYEARQVCDDEDTKITLTHIGSQAYFGIYLRDILHPNTTIIPSPFQISFPLPTAGHLIVKNNMQNILNSAPCEGNYRLFPNVPGPYWGASNRIDRPDPLWRPTCGDGNQGEYAGLDYLLFHNMYYLLEGTSNPIYDMSDRKVTINMPTSSNNFSATNKNTLGAFEYITASNSIAFNGAVDFRAGKEISFLDGMSITQGADVSARIIPYFCSGISDPMSRTTDENNFYEGPTHFSSKPEKQKEVNNVANESSPDYIAVNEFMQQLDSVLKFTNELSVFQNKIEIYPNPNDGVFFISFNLSKEDNITLQLFDVFGKEVYSHKNITGYLVMPVDLKEFKKGVYVAKFISSNGNEEVRKIILQ